MHKPLDKWNWHEMLFPAEKWFEGLGTVLWWKCPCRPGSIVLVQTIYDKMEKYGRFFGYVWHMPGYGQLGENSSVNRLMIQAGHAVAWDGRNK